MTRKPWLVATTVIPAAIAVAPAPAVAQTQGVDWQVERGLALGTGCNSLLGDTAFISFGNQATVLFRRFGVTLPEGPDDPRLSYLENCSVRIPATIRRGYYLGELVQTITYGVNKTEYSTGRITSLASFFNTPVASFTVDIALGAANAPALTETRSSPVPMASACGASPLAGLYRADLAVSGNRADTTQSIIVAAQGLDLRYDVVFPVSLCPFP